MSCCLQRAMLWSSTQIIRSSPIMEDSSPDLGQMRGLKRLRSARMISSGHAFVQNIRRGHDELSVQLDPQHRLPAALAELALAI
jgi:hypothetical protein